MNSLERLKRLQDHMQVHFQERNAYYITEVLKHCEYLLKLEHEERLIKLPFKIGDKLYLIRTAVNSNKPRLGKATTVSYRNLGYVLQNYGITMFTKEVAELKIKEME